MTDKQVGELWRADPEGYGTSTRALIRKLVEERAKHRGGTTEALSVQLALSDFGIDPSEWASKPATGDE